MVYKSSERQEKRKISTRGKIRVATIWSVGFMILVAIGLTGALLHAILTPSTSEFTFAKLNQAIEIVEDFNGWEKKQVSVKNADDSPQGVVRVSILPTAKDATGKLTQANFGEITDPGSKTTMVLGDLTLTFASDWQDNWFYKNGYFYYRKVLDSGETSTNLLEKVSLTNDTAEIRSKYADKTIEIEVMADIIETSNNAPKDAWGVTVTDNTVSPSS